MTDEVQAAPVPEPVPTVAAVVETPEQVQEERAKEDLRFWIVKAFTIAFLATFTVSILVLVYAAVFKEKDLNTTFIGEVFKGMFDLIRFLLS